MKGATVTTGWREHIQKVALSCELGLLFALVESDALHLSICRYNEPLPEDHIKILVFTCDCF